MFAAMGVGQFFAAVSSRPDFRPVIGKSGFTFPFFGLRTSLLLRFWPLAMI
jgi:hypothetical protein